MSPKAPPVLQTLPSFPRVSGDEPDSQARQALAKGFSPRERG